MSCHCRAEPNSICCIQAKKKYNVFGSARLWLVNSRTYDFAGISFIQTHPPGTRLERSENRPPGQSLCTNTLPSGQNRESKAPPPEHKLRKFHKYVYKL